MAPKTSLRIASASGSAADRRHGLASLAATPDIQYIVGDWLSEANMATRGAAKIASDGASDEFEAVFLEALEPALGDIKKRGAKVVVNAGASDTEKLCRAVEEMVGEKRLGLRVAWVGGDEVMDVVKEGVGQGEEFRSLTTGKPLSSWGFDPIYAQCYLGAWGIVSALTHGADIVLCGRVADASPTIACAAYHYSWTPENYTELGRALIAGHFIECSTYVTGGNFTGFKNLPGDVTDLAFPIVEVLQDGNFVVTMQEGKGGMVTVETCKAQLLYEIQGPLYYNSDVVAQLDGIKMEQVGENRVHITNIIGIKPPPTTKVGLTAPGGFQAEAHYFLCGLDLPEKAQLLERQLRSYLPESKYHCLKFRVSGRCPKDPQSQDAATVDLRIFAQARDAMDLSPDRFLRPIMDNIMQSYPGATFALDVRQALPKPYFEYWVSLLPQASVKHVCHIPWKDTTVDIPPSSDTQDFVHEQASYETESPVDISALGATRRVPLGYIVHARSGDKGSDSNVGFFVRHEREWDWLRSFLTVDKLRALLGEDDTGKPVFRFELPHIWAVHFLLKDHLDRGATSSSSYDILGKNVAEYLRCKLVDIPVRFLERGRI